LLLQFDGVETDRQPGVVWEIYVGLPANAQPDPASPYYVGNVSLFGTGIRGESHGHDFKPAHFQFAINRAIQAAMRTSATNVSVTAVPSGILINGKPSRPKAASTVHIGQVSLSVQTAKPQ
jgi:hypothetical protein